MMTDREKSQNRQAGFSMVEVLVASSILVVIVLMLSMLFQQTSLSWRTGVRRAEAFMAVRSAIGAIQRDAAAAVDERTIPKPLRNTMAGSQQFSGSLRFFTLTGAGFDDAMNTPYRALKYVTYNSSGARTESVLQADGSKKTMPNSNVLNFVDKASSANKPVTRITAFDPVPGDDPAGLPLYVNIRAQVTYSGNALEIGAQSAGPDKVFDTKDDIKTW